MTPGVALSETAEERLKATIRVSKGLRLMTDMMSDEVETPRV